MRTCKTCNLELEVSRFAENRKICKKCRNKTKSDSMRRRIASGEIDFDVRLNYWMNHTILKNGRKHLTKDFLKEKALEGLKKFPYMKFVHINKNKKNHSAHPFSASLDRINPNLGYQEDNIQVIPTWLNSAKLNCPVEILIPLLRDFVKNYEDFKKNLEEIVTGNPSV